MGTVAVLGAEAVIQGYTLAGAVPLVAENAAEAADVWATLPPGVVVVVLTPDAAAALAEGIAAPGAPMTVVMPA